MDVSHFCPEETVWFLESSGGRYGPKVQGSAVAIKLQEIGFPTTAETYLLTCAHVIRQEGGSGEEYNYLRAWQYDTGKTNETAFTVTPFLRPPSQAQGYRKNKDWVVLRIEEPGELIGTTVGPWIEDPQGHCKIYGYPGESSFLKPGVVLPTDSKPFAIRMQNEFHVILSGAETRSGMSGGGLFDGIMLAGIHRARGDDSLQLHSISAKSILQQLRELGFEPTDWRPQSLQDLTALLVGMDGELVRSAYQSSLPISHQNPVPYGMEANEKVVIRLMEFGRNEAGNCPIDEFVHYLWKESAELEIQGRLRTWLEKFAKSQFSDVERPKDQRVKSKEPRIVIRMRPASSNTKRTPFPCSDKLADLEISDVGPLYTYQIWFVGFKQSPRYQTYDDYRELFPNVINWAWQFVKGEHTPNKVWIELSLPRDLLQNWQVEREEVNFDRYTNSLGGTHHFVLRYEDREYPRSVEDRIHRAFSNSSKEKPIKLCCIPFENASNEECKDSHCLIELDGKTNCKTAHTKLAQQSTVLAAYLNSAPLAKDINALDGVLDCGVPLVIWLRNDAPNGQNNLSGRLQQTEWDSIPSKLQEIRGEVAEIKENDWTLSREMAVIFDTPRRPMPDDTEGRSMWSPHTNQNR